MDIPVIGRKRTKRVKWSGDDVKFLVDNHKELNASQIGKALGRTKNAVKEKASSLGLDMTVHQNLDTKGYVYNLFFNERMQPKEIAELLEASEVNVRNHLGKFLPSKEQKFKIMQENYNRHLKEEAKNGK